MHHSLLVVPFEPWHLTVMDIREEQHPTLESMVNEYGSVETYATLMLEAAAEFVDGEKTALTFLKNGFPILSSGVFPLSTHVAQAWMMVSNQFLEATKREKHSITKRLRLLIDEEGSFGRIQADTETWFSEGARFLEYLGFKREGVMRNFNSDGSDSYLYGYVRGKNVR